MAWNSIILIIRIIIQPVYIILQDTQAKLISRMRRPQTTIRATGGLVYKQSGGYAAKTQLTQYCSNLKLYIGSTGSLYT